jgi:predicted nucleic acid-binding protein
MRNKFPGYFRPTDDEFKKMWEEGVFVFDTNVLLDLFRYSQETVNTLLRIMESVKERIWLPYQVSKEYYKNLPDIISDQAIKYKESIKTLKLFNEQIEAERSHPFLKPKQHKEIAQFYKRIDKQLSLRQEEIEKSLIDNPIKEKIADLFKDKIGEQFSDDELEKIFNEGEKRYKENIPPGYKDKLKPGNEKYGDLVIWKEILKKSKEIDKPIILVTGEKKEDWFLTTKIGKTIGPRPELIGEMKKEKDILFYCYPTNKFLLYAEEYLKAEIDKEIYSEVEKYIGKPGVISETDAEKVGYLLEKLGETGPFISDEDTSEAEDLSLNDDTVA